MFGLTLLQCWAAIWADGARAYPDVPRNHWVIEGLARAKRDGLSVGSSDGLGYPKVKTKSEMATQVAFAMNNLRNLAKSMVCDRKRLVALKSSDERVQAYDADFNLLVEARADLAFFRAAQCEFLPQMLRFRIISPGEIPWISEVEVAVNRTLSLGAEPFLPS